MDNISKKLQDGMLTTCSLIWNKDKQDFEYADSTQMAQCCVKSCVKPVEFCHKNCSKYKKRENIERCLLTCNKQRQLCMDNCIISVPYVGKGNNYIECTKEKGCMGINEFPDIDCVKKNRSDIFKCCRENCIPRKNLDCQKHCEFLEKVTIDPSQLGIPRISTEELQDMISEQIKRKNKNTKSNKKFPMYTLGIILCILIILINIRLIYYFKK